MYKATDLQSDVIFQKKIQRKLYSHQLKICMNEIKTTNNSGSKYIIFRPPVLISGEPHYIQDECVIFLKRNLIDYDYYVRLVQPGDSIFISWDPTHITKKFENEKNRRSQERQEDDDIEEFYCDPSDPFDFLGLTANLLEKNKKPIKKKGYN